MSIVLRAAGTSSFTRTLEASVRASLRSRSHCPKVPYRYGFFLPGTAAIFCMALDEDGTKRDAMEGAFNDVKNEVRDRFNDFLNGLDLQSMAAAAFASPTPLATAKALLDQQLNKFAGLLPDVINVAIQSAELSVMSDWSLWDPFSWLASADAD